MPETTLPHTVYCLSRKRASSKQMKNWLFALFGLCARAIEAVPRTCGSDYPDLKAEFSAEPHVRGTASMARAQSPNSANSQFFICFDDARFLDKQYTVWGKVTEGMENVDKIKRGEPVRDPDKIERAYIQADAK